MEGGDQGRRIRVELSEEEYEMLRRIREKLKKEGSMRLWKSILLTALLQNNTHKPA